MGARKWCFVGGASGLIGSAIADLFHREGYEVVKADLEEGADLANESNVLKIFDERFPKQCEHGVVVNCQAIADPYSGKLDELELSKWRSYLDANLTSYFLVCREFARRFKGKSGRIINLSSTRRTMAEPNTEAYCATKGAVTSFSKALAVSLGHRGITVNSVSPGWISGESDIRKIDHQQHPAGRVGRPSDIAGLCLFLAGEGSGFITGEDVVVDGGMTVRMIYEE